MDPFGYKQWTQSTQVCKNTGSNSVYNVQSVLDKEGGIIVWWIDDRNAELDQWFNYTQNALYMQRINKFGQKMWSDTGIQVASLEGGWKHAYGVDDGANGIILIQGESDFYRANKTNKEYKTLIRYNDLGKQIWKILIDSANTQGVLPGQPIYRLKNKILYFTLDGPQLIDTSGNKSKSPIINFGGIISDGDSVLYSSREVFFDSVSQQYSKKLYTKYSDVLDTIWSIDYSSKSLRSIGDGGAWTNPFYQIDNAGGIFTSNGYYVSPPFIAHIFVQHINQ
ncbi:MAG: hypothetical protein Q8K92_26055, partial [Leadbetterella sp.]|nr:hypothetical protein [Leadbetterella sp.]